MKRVDITFLINAHAEGLLLVPALQSARAARKLCVDAGISVELVLVADSPDDDTRKIVEAWNDRLDVVRYVEHRNLALARTEGLSVGHGEYFCFLDGDDIWQAEWPLLAWRFARTRDAKSTIFHTEVLAGFGTEHFLRKQIGTDDALFHPNHLVAIWHFCNNLFAHRTIFARFPIEPYDHASGFGSEDWHWSCETCAGGIGRIPVPGTAYFYRRDQRKQNLGHVSFLARPETELFRSDPRVPNYSAWLGSAQPSAALITAMTAIRDSRRVPGWLIDATTQAAAHGKDLWSLINRLSALRVETPELLIGVALAFAEIASLFAEAGQFGLVFVRTEGREPRVLAKMLRTLAACAEDIPLVVCLDRPIAADRPVQREGRLLYLDIGFLFRLSDDVPYSLHQLFSTAIVQFRPMFVLNVEHWFGDSLSDYRATLEHLAIRYGYVGEGDPGDPSDRAVRPVFARLTRAATWYNEIWLGTDNASHRACELYPPDDMIRIMLLGDADIADVLHAAIRNDVSVSRQCVPALLPVLFAKGPPQVSCVLNVHREREVLGPTLRSVVRMLAKAAQSGIAVELLVVCDDCDAMTRAMIVRFAAEYPGDMIRVLDVAHRDLGLARNTGVQAARGEYLCFLDGDDLYSENWIVAAIGTMQTRSETDLVLHPELNVYFGEQYRLFWHRPWEHRDTPRHGIMFENYWTALSFARRQRYLDLPFSPVDIANGLGFEDWHWNLETLARGWSHDIVQKTCHFIRLKHAGSLNQLSSKNLCVIRPTRFIASLVQPEP